MTPRWLLESEAEAEFLFSLTSSRSLRSFTGEEIRSAGRAGADACLIGSRERP